MAILFNNAVVKGGLYPITLSNSRPNPYFVFTSTNEVEATNYILWGILRFIRVRSAPTGTRATVFAEYLMRAPDHRFSVLDVAVAGVQDALQFVPLYDFGQVVIFDNAP